MMVDQGAGFQLQPAAADGLTFRGQVLAQQAKRQPAPGQVLQQQLQFVLYSGSVPVVAAAVAKAEGTSQAEIVGVDA